MSKGKHIFGVLAMSFLLKADDIANASLIVLAVSSAAGLLAFYS